MSFFTDRVARLAPGANRRHQHFFGGAPRHRGAIPRGKRQPVHLLYDLDLSDEKLGLRFPGLTRLPLYNALQYNCCDIVYRVISDDEIEIVSNVQDHWDPTFPYEGYPAQFERVPIVAEPLSYEDYKTTVFAHTVDRGPSVRRVSDADARRLRDLGYPFTQVGGVQFMWQGEPQWDCANRGCKYFRQAWATEVFAVVWESPVPGLHLWIPADDDRDTGSVPIIFSRCTGCGIIHSCNRCD
jgi:hypothetical protein